MKPETTSQRVAKIAGRLLRVIKSNECKSRDYLYLADGTPICKVSDVKSVIASALNQAGDRK